jgi:hypothetical protein
MTGPRRDDTSDRLADLYDRFAGALFRYAAVLLGIARQRSTPSSTCS